MRSQPRKKFLYEFKTVKNNKKDLDGFRGDLIIVSEGHQSLMVEWKRQLINIYQDENCDLIRIFCVLTFNLYG